MALLLAVVVVALSAVLARAAPDGADAPDVGVPHVLSPVTNPTTAAKVDLGRRLFSDHRISVDGSHSCASCHIAALAFTDARAVPLGIGDKPLRRNAPTLVNVALVRDYFHDGRAPSLEEQARQVFLNPDELGWPDAAAPAAQIGQVPEYPPLFEKAFGSRDVTLQRMLRAIAAFERTLVAGDAPFDRWWRGDENALTAEQKHGYRLFIDRGGCAQCHAIRQSHATFSDARFHNTGAGAEPPAGVTANTGKADPGRAAVTGDPADTGAFRTPTLRNVELTGPYMHDGSLATLAAVVDFYVDGGGANPHLSPLVRPLELDEVDRNALVAFLKALTSPAMPHLAECDRALAEGRPNDALRLFRAELARDPGSLAAVTGIARAALSLAEREPLLEAEHLLRTAVRGPAPDDGDDAAVLPLLVLQGRVSRALSESDDAMALARAEDALIAWERVLNATGGAPDVRRTTVPLLTDLLEFMGRRDRAVQVAEVAAEEFPDLAEHLAQVLYRRAWQTLSGAPTDAERADLARTAALLDDLASGGTSLDAESLLFRPYAHHRLGEIEAARDAYLAAVRADETVAERALTGLRNLLTGDLARYRSDLDDLLRTRPDSPTVLLFAGWERLQERRFDESERLLRLRMDREPTPTAGPRVYLARVERAHGDFAAATANYAAALAIDPSFPGLVAEYEGVIRSRELDGFAAVDALIADYATFFAANPDDARFQCLARNNLAFTLRDVAASFCTRGAARHHTFAPGAPDDARRILHKSVGLYEEAVALIPQNVADLPFAERWAYAGVLNDLGLMLHYFDDVRDVERAEQCYLRAFDLTDGSYQDAYFYNLQFLYAFELDGRSERWFELAGIAENAILKEDATSPSGFAPDPVKRRAARRDRERLAAALGR